MVTENLISAIRVNGLFGLYNYKLPESGEFSNATILYGDNGVGKSTLLRLAFHLLSAGDARGHRTALYKAEFEKLEVDLASGITLTARMERKSSSRLLSMSIIKSGKLLAIWDYQKQTTERYLYASYEAGGFEIDSDGQLLKIRPSPNSKRTQDSTPRGEEAYLSVLAQHVPATFILNADRRLDSDTVADPSDEMELRKVMRYEEPKRINELVVRSREIALSQALSAASRWVSRKAVKGANQGSMNVHSVYIAVLQHLLASKPSQDDEATEGTVDTLLEQLTTIESKTAKHAHYELATELSVSEFRKALNSRAKKRSVLTAKLLKPYIKSLEGRLDAVDPIYQIIDRFVTIVNSFLNDKTISFKLTQGFTIHNRLGNPLEPPQLSSGEQQLLLLFCYVLTARDNPSVFMIDEPEISLNIKWQRQLIQSLLDITAGSTIQFIFASHSMELLALHRSRVVKLESKA